MVINLIFLGARFLKETYKLVSSSKLMKLLKSIKLIMDVKLSKQILLREQFSGWDLSMLKIGFGS